MHVSLRRSLRLHCHCERSEAILDGPYALVGYRHDDHGDQERGWVIAWDEALRRQVYRRGVDLAFADDRILFLGRDFTGRPTG